MIRLNLKEDGLFDWSPFDATVSRCLTIAEHPTKGLLENSNSKVCKGRNDCSVLILFYKLTHKENLLICYYLRSLPSTRR